MAKNFKTLQAKMAPQAGARSEAKAERMIQNMALDELRAAWALIQEHLSILLGVQQSAVSKPERRTAMYVSTLSHFIQAMGEQLESRAVFPDSAVRITQFHALAAENEQSVRMPRAEAGMGAAGVGADEAERRVGEEVGG
jgi:hypothetical protein